MFNISKKVRARIVTSLHKYQPIIQAALARDVNETDTVTIVKDFFSDCFGYDKYSELTSEFAIRGTFCDLAVKIENRVKLLIEIKAPGVDLKENQIKQAVDYASNSGVEWVVLTNAVMWKLYKIEFKQPIEAKLVSEFNLLEFSPKIEETQQSLFIFTREGLTKSALEDFYGKSEATSKYLIGSVLLSDTILSAIKREIRKIHTDVKIEDSAISTILLHDIIKREVLESPQFNEDQKMVKKMQSREQKKKEHKKTLSALVSHEPACAEESATIVKVS
ncbi:MAG: type I restriction enzyme HsdR N-terminal domain-containing protein [Bdellovibrionaceae bacterium]|nr:type I restriction enzyme HsdR N-terminal domain-containing protein [Pseudobdellovibrionaceae bacterium]